MFEILKAKNETIKTRKRTYFSTHEFLLDHFGDLTQEQKALFLKKSHEIRKLQDQFCYIHSVFADEKIFTSKEHKRLESAIRNNLKCFSIFYIDFLPDHKIKLALQKEAIIQKSMLKRMKPLQVVLARNTQISWSLSYSFSRSYDYYFSEVKNDA